MTGPKVARVSLKKNTSGSKLIVADLGNIFCLNQSRFIEPAIIKLNGSTSIYP
jgi:hypothetical protein